jgi:2,4-diketo-3-deoxy-L-fuconate hydrolase
LRFVTFSHGGETRAGVLTGDARHTDDTIHDLAHPAQNAALGGTAPDLQQMLERGLGDVVTAIAAHGLANEAELWLGDVKLLAPIPAPRRIFGIAHNYKDALRERGMAPPADPVQFDKFGSTVIATGEPIVLPKGIGGVTYEAELAAVIGRGGENIAPDGALGHVAGYAAFNDISASELIKRDGNFTRGKNLPSFGPFGPYLASADEIEDPQRLRVWLDMDGQRLQDSTSAEMLFDVATLISILSTQTRLEPGDVIATGTPAGVAPVRTPPTWLRPGASVTMGVEGLGQLENPVVEGPPLYD